MASVVHNSRAMVAWTAVAVAFVLACGTPRLEPQEDGDVDARADTCALQCSADLHAITDCHDNVVETCGDETACEPTSFTCRPACEAAESNHRSVGCDYYATQMDPFLFTDKCFAAFVANTWTTPAKISIEYRGQTLPAQSFTRIPSGSGPTLAYTAYDPNIGVPPGEVAIVFLAGKQGAAPDCPVTPGVVGAASITGTGIGAAFHIRSNVPVVAYQINPYGGGSAAYTGASLLLPTSVWDREYVAVNVVGADYGMPSLNIIAHEDATQVTLTPNVAVTGSSTIAGGPAGEPITIDLDKGQQAQISQATELTGSTISSTKPVGFMAGHTCMEMPAGTLHCDHAEQMVPPVTALGSRYVGVMYRPRLPSETRTFWRIVGTVDATMLTYSTDVGGPARLDKGEYAVFETGTPFTVESQNSEHPFMLFTYMTSSAYVMTTYLGESTGYGDPDFVTSVPPEQYLRHYVFFADPTYPETNLVIVRKRGLDGQFHEVNLDCAGALAGWTPIGPDFEFTRQDLMTGNFSPVGGCSTGRHEIDSEAPFGLWVWGWGTPLTTIDTKNVSYGYPGGMNVAPINAVIL